MGDTVKLLLPTSLINCGHGTSSKWHTQFLSFLAFLIKVRGRKVKQQEDILILEYWHWCVCVCVLGVLQS